MSSRDTVQELDTATIIQFIAAQFPEVAPTTIEFLGEGPDFRAFIVRASRRCGIRSPTPR